MKIIFIAFNCRKSNSILYSKVDISKEVKLLVERDDTEELDFRLRLRMGDQLLKALKQKADFVSVRFIK